MIRRVVNVVVGDFFKKRWLRHESFIAYRCDEEFVVGRFGCGPACVGQFLFEEKPVGAVERDAVAVTCKFPIGFGRYLFFEGVKKFLDGKSPVLEKVKCYRELDFFIKCRESNIFYWGACRNGDRVVFSVVVERDEDGGREALFAPFDKASCHIQILVAEVFCFSFENLAELVEIGGLLFLIVFCGYGEKLRKCARGGLILPCFEKLVAVA